MAELFDEIFETANDEIVIALVIKNKVMEKMEEGKNGE